jgi:hypothetical protein
VQRIGIVVALTLLGALFFLQGIHWGLPSRNVDPFLFGSHPRWSGEQILILIGTISDKRAADVSSRPLDRSHGPVIVNATDQDRARIVRRYRLMSYQPDEFATFAALVQLQPSRLRLDPRMYKYGGLWVYPVGAMLKVGGLLGLVHLNPDATYYLDHPEEFGRFYVVARCYSAAWGLAGILAIFLLVHRCCGSICASICGAVCFMLMPVIITGGHEAKPHLAGAVFMLLAVLAASNFVEYGRSRAALAAAILCGAAIGMVPSAFPVLLVLPAMMVLRRWLCDPALSPSHILRAAIGWLSVAGFVYSVTNPYVLINLVRDRAVLRSNLGNSAAFYHASISGRGLGNACLLIGLGTSLILAAGGGVGTVALAWRAARVKCTDQDELRRRATGMLLAAATFPVAIVFFLFATNQPADYARFALPFDVFLAVEAVAAVATFVHKPVARVLCFGILVATTAFNGSSYLHGFIRDSSSQTTRLADARRIRALLASGSRVLASREEPAPWSLPPVDLFQWQVILPPRDLPEDEPFAGADVTIGPAGIPPISEPLHLLTVSPINWAAKPFDMQLAGKTGAGNRSTGAVH